jgi:hypothetical protein
MSLSHRDGPGWLLSRRRARSVGNPFDRAWPPTTSGDLQPIFSSIDSPLTCVYTWVRVYVRGYAISIRLWGLRAGEVTCSGTITLQSPKDACCVCICVG